MVSDNFSCRGKHVLKYKPKMQALLVLAAVTRKGTITRKKIEKQNNKL